jgi:hypothetical protein
MLRYARAVISMTKTAFGMNKVTEQEYHQRLAACSKCPALIAHKGPPKCGACGCLVELKALDKTEKCPVGRPEWSVENAPKTRV